jgi:hypothetical protein
MKYFPENNNKKQHDLPSGWCPEQAHVNPKIMTKPATFDNLPAGRLSRR